MKKWEAVNEINQKEEGAKWDSDKRRACIRIG
jgi:hypothetical protein